MSTKGLAPAAALLSSLAIACGSPTQPTKSDVSADWFGHLEQTRCESNAFDTRTCAHAASGEFFLRLAQSGTQVTGEWTSEYMGWSIPVSGTAIQGRVQLTGVMTHWTGQTELFSIDAGTEQVRGSWSKLSGVIVKRYASQRPTRTRTGEVGTVVDVREYTFSACAAGGRC